MNDYSEQIKKYLPFCLAETHLPIPGKKYQGKVRDTYEVGNELILVTTDRQSAFNRVLATVPYKGQVLNLVSAYWFEKTRSIVPNHVIAVPDPNVIIAKKCEVFPIEFIVRGFITGTTETSLWTLYQQGIRQYGDTILPEGLRKNERLEKPLLTPTTKDKDRDRPITSQEIIREGLMTAADWEAASTIVLQLFAEGVKTATAQGLILVDTKYELGKDQAGNIVLVDEIHTPDSSRYWLAESYEECFANHIEPHNIDKEFLRLWFAKHCDPYQDKVLPEAPLELIVTLANRYLLLFEMIIGNSFAFTEPFSHPYERILANLNALGIIKI